MKDILGQEIKNGQFIAYGIRSGNSGSLHVGVVKDVTKMTVIPLLVEYTFLDKEKWIYRIGRTCALSGWYKTICLSEDQIEDERLFEIYRKVVDNILS